MSDVPGPNPRSAPIPSSHSPVVGMKHRPSSDMLSAPPRFDIDAPLLAPPHMSLRTSVSALRASRNPNRLSNFVGSGCRTGEAGCTTAESVDPPFLAPGLPHGRVFGFHMLSSHGNTDEIGLNGIEIFNGDGTRIVPAPSSSSGPPFTVSAFHRSDEGQWHPFTPPPPAMIGDGIEHRHDVANVVRGDHRTHDENQCFVMPFLPSAHHVIAIMFEQPVTASMLRIYNYSGGGRTQTFKGVKSLEVTVDDRLVFRGDIKECEGSWRPAALPAPNRNNSDDSTPSESDDDVDAAEEAPETVLFCEDVRVLESIELSGRSIGRCMRWHPSWGTTASRFRSPTSTARTTLGCLKRATRSCTSLIFSRRWVRGIHWREC